MRYRLRTLLIILALGPPVLAGAWFGWAIYRERQLKPELDRLRRVEIYDWEVTTGTAFGPDAGKTAHGADVAKEKGL